MQSIKIKMQYYLLETTEVVLEWKIFKIRDTFRTTYDWYYLVLNYFSKFFVYYKIFILEGSTGRFKFPVLSPPTGGWGGPGKNSYYYKD